jgi:hypothetical protein
VPDGIECAATLDSTQRPRLPLISEKQNLSVRPTIIVVRELLGAKMTPDDLKKVVSLSVKYRKTIAPPGHSGSLPRRFGANGK